MSVLHPEIADLISDYLEPHSLSSCLRVCKSWHTLFIPRLYRIIRNLSKQKQEDPTFLSVFRRYGHFIRILETTDKDFPDPELFGPDCRFLTKIYIIGELDYFSTTCTQRLLTLIDNNPHIHTFSIQSDLSLQTDLDFLISNLNILRHLPALKELDLREITIKRKSTWDEILECGQRLDLLNCIGLNLKSIKDMIHLNTSIESGSQEQVMWKLTTLRYMSDPSFGMPLLERCPNLTDFVGNDFQYIEALIKHHHSGYPLQIQHFSLYDFFGKKNESALEEFIRICSESSGLKTFNVVISHAINNDLSALATFHAETLEKVQVLGYKLSITIYALHELLGSCPRLKSLAFPGQRISMEALVQLPWVCKDLEVLEINVQEEWNPNLYVDSDSGESSDEEYDKIQPSASGEGHKSMEKITELRRRLWNQIGAMTNLKKLHIHQDRIKSCSEECRHIRIGDDQMCNLDALVMMDDGLEYILRLRQLVYFEINRRAFRISDSEMAILRMRRPGLRINFID